MKDKKAFWFWLLLPLIVGAISGFISKSGMDQYNALAIKPPLSPPEILFPIVWTILYLLVGYGAYRALSSSYDNEGGIKIAFAVQMVLNFIWTPIFFVANAYTLASVVLVAVIVSVIIMMIQFYKADKTAGLIQIPYLLWSCFALYLNIATSMLN